MWRSEWEVAFHWPAWEWTAMRRALRLSLWSDGCDAASEVGGRLGGCRWWSRGGGGSACDRLSPYNPGHTSSWAPRSDSLPRLVDRSRGWRYRWGGWRNATLLRLRSSPGSYGPLRGGRAWLHARDVCDLLPILTLPPSGQRARAMWQWPEAVQSTSNTLSITWAPPPHPPSPLMAANQMAIRTRRVALASAVNQASIAGEGEAASLCKGGGEVWRKGKLEWKRPLLGKDILVFHLLTASFPPSFRLPARESWRIRQRYINKTLLGRRRQMKKGKWKGLRGGSGVENGAPLTIKLVVWGTWLHPGYIKYKHFDYMFADITVVTGTAAINNNLPPHTTFCCEIKKEKKSLEN